MNSDITGCNERTPARANASHPQSPARDLVKDLMTAALDLLPLLEEAAAVQYDAPPTARPAEDTHQRAQGPHSDPTPGLALDERRLALSEQVKASERLVRSAAISIRATRAGIEAALETWAGR